MTHILITGGTGSLGRALVNKLLKDPRYGRICIYSRDEHKQEQMASGYTAKQRLERLRFFIGDTRDRDRLDLAVRGVDEIIHAAALKIVPAMEYNPTEAVKTNIYGTQNIIDCAVKYGKHKVILVSTDKAVHPINLYGATKLCAEKLIIAANNLNGPLNFPHMSVVRYGNVANSNGSIIPRFAQQHKAGVPLTVTDDRMSRFWITLDEATTFVLRCMNTMKGGEIFVPQMSSFKVKDLALAFHDKYDSMHPPIEIVGIRPGEKLSEVIITAEEMPFCEQNSFGDSVIRPNTEPRAGEHISAHSNSAYVERLDIEDLRTKLYNMGVL